MQLPSFRKQLSAPGLLKTVRRCFEKVTEHRTKQPAISLTDALMSGLAVFQLKYPSLLKFDEGRKEEAVRHNLRTLFGVARAPCDTQLRAICDPVAPQALHEPFRLILNQLQKSKALAAYRYLGGRYLVSLDGTGQFASAQVNCQDCCVKTHRNGETAYYHQLLGAVLIHPDQKLVIPFAPEPILRHDGENKNDCERAASKRLLTRLREAFPKLPLIITEDSLAANGPHVKLLKKLNMSFILMVKEGDHQALFDQVQQALVAGRTEEFEAYDPGIDRHRGYRFVNQLPLNASHPDCLVNFLEYWETDATGKEVTYFTWITDITLSRANVYQVMRGGRARWKVENETFNTLKNQGYRLEHNYGHGQQHLATVLALLMMLAFLIDQTQELCCGLFQRARQRFRSRTSLWHKMQALFTALHLDNWLIFWKAIILGYEPLKPAFCDTS